MPQKSNPLFFYLVNHRGLSTRCDTSDRPYVLIESPISQPPELTKVTSHLTVYETYDPENTCLTPLHYSAYFTHPNSHEYRVHVYFDAKGNFVRGPLCSVQQPDGSWSPCKFDSFDRTAQLMDFFITDAITTIHPWAATLYREIFDKLRTLQLQERDITQSFVAAGDDLPRKKRFLTNWITNLTAQYHLHSKGQKAHLIRLRRILRAIDTEIDRLKYATPLPKTKPKTEVTQPWVKSSASPVAKKKIPASQPFLPELEEKKQRFETAASLPDVLQQAKTFSDLTVWLLDVPDSVLNALSLAQHTEFNQLVTAVENAGASLFRSQFLTTAPLNEALIEQLRLLAPSDLTAELASAAKHHDSQRVRYLLKFDPELAQAPLSLGKRTHYPSLVNYCVALTEQNTAPTFVAECIQLLIEQGVSLVVKMSNSPLNFVEWLSYQPAHPLNLLLAESGIWYQPNTYVVLRAWLLDSDDTGLSPEEIEIKRGRLELYTQKIRSLSALTSDDVAGMLDPKRIQKMLVAESQRMGLTIDERIRLESHPEITALTSQLIEVGAKLHCLKSKSFSRWADKIWEEAIMRDEDDVVAKQDISQLPFEEKLNQWKRELSAELAETEQALAKLEDPVNQALLHRMGLLAPSGVEKRFPHNRHPREKGNVPFLRL